MNVELICVGSELLSGDVVNTNASYISKKLRELGHESFRQFTVDDNKYRLIEILNDSLRRCDILILTGGLGPTADDITKETVCEALGVKLVENDICKKHIDEFFRSAGRTPTQNNYKQATAPENAIIFKNDIGTACGMCIESNDKRIILLPGPPRELTAMFENHVVPYLKTLNHRAIVTHTLNVFGLGESAIETMISEHCSLDNPVVATYCGNNECAVKITATADSEPEAEGLCRRTMLSIKEILGDHIYACDSLGMEHEVVNLLRKSDLKISTAESCTGGMLSQALTSVPHSSDVVEIGILAYSNRIKHEALSVPRDVLEEKGAICAETAMYLAKNVRILSDSDIGVGITGNAGPTASENKPIGLVYVSIADSTKYYVKKLTLPSTYDREKIRSYATLTALDLVRKYVSARPYTMPGMVSFESDFSFEEEPAKESEVFASSDALENKPVFDPNINFIVFDDENEDESVEEAVTENLASTEPTIEEIARFESTEIPDEPVEVKDEAHADEALEKAKKSPLLSLLFKIFPTKKDGIKDIILKSVSILAVIGLLVSSTVLISHFADESHQRAIITTARENFDFENEEKNEETGAYNVFDDLYSQNPDIKGWISISNTKVDNPIYQSSTEKDRDFYLTHNMLKKKSRYGALYFDFNNHIEFENNSKNLTIYGHDMRDKSMFGSLSKFRDLSFYKKNSIIKLKTLYDQNDYVIFATFVANAKAADDNGYLYNYTLSQFESSEHFLSWIDEALERSLITTNIEIDENDEILTLSTCCYDFDDARYVIMAKKLDNSVAAPDVSSAAYNKNARYPQAWYDKRGLEGYKSANDDNSSSSSPSTDENSSTVTDSSGENSSETESGDESTESVSSQGSSSSSSLGTTTSSTPSTSKPSSSSTTSSSKPSSSQTSSEQPSSTTSTTPNSSSEESSSNSGSDSSEEPTDPESSGSQEVEP